jgi:hypothetical protein
LWYRQTVLDNPPWLFSAIKTGTFVPYETKDGEATLVAPPPEKRLFKRLLNLAFTRIGNPNYHFRTRV